MDKETIIHWLRECSDEGSGERCEQCPYYSHQDCAGQLMQDAAQILNEEKGA